METGETGGVPPVRMALTLTDVADVGMIHHSVQPVPRAGEYTTLYALISPEGTEQESFAFKTRLMNPLAGVTVETLRAYVTPAHVIDGEVIRRVPA
jgi:hypothetical protein